MKEIAQLQNPPEVLALSNRKSRPVCTFCKKRKIKCDRQTPCCSCVKFSNSECVYLETKRTRKHRTVKASTIESEIDLLKLKIEDLEHSVRHKSSVSHDLAQAEQIELSAELTEVLKPIQDVRFNLLADVSTVFTMDGFRRGNFGPTTLKCVTKFDLPIYMVWSFVASKVNKMKSANAFKQLPDSTLLKMLDDPINTEMDVDGPSECVHKTEPLIGPGFSPEYKNDVSGLIKQIEQMLPVKQVIYKYLDWFFSFLYLFYPFLDQAEFEGRIRFLIPKVELHERPRNIQIESVLDLAYLGILLTVLRLTFVTLSVSHNGEYQSEVTPTDATPDSLEIRYLLKHPIGIDSVHTARECLAQFDMYGLIKLPIMQLALFVRIYRIHGPEYGDNCDMGNESRIHNGTLFQIAYSFGLNRDPDSCPLTTVVPRFDNLNRKIWYYLLYLDMSQSLEFGDPLCSAMYPFDVKPPFVTSENCNVDNIEVEKAVAEWFQFVAEVYEPLKYFFAANINFQCNTEITKVMKELAYLEKEVFRLQEFRDHFVDSGVSRPAVYDISELLRYTLQLQFGYFIVSYYHILFNFFEKKGNQDVAYYFLKTGLTKHFVEFVPFLCHIAKGSKACKYHADLIFMPIALLSLHRGVVSLFSLLVRNKITISNYENSPNHIQKMTYDFQYGQQYLVLKEILLLCLEISDLLLNVIKFFSTRFYYSWVVRKLHTFLSMVVRTNLFEERVYREYMEFPILNDQRKARDILNALQETKAKQQNCSPTFVAQFEYGSDFPLSEMLGGGVDSTSSEISSLNTLPTSTEDSISLKSTKDVDSLWFNLFANKDVKSKTNVYTSEFEELVLRTNLEPFFGNIDEALGMQVPTPNDGGAEFLNLITFDELFNDLTR